MGIHKLKEFIGAHKDQLCHTVPIKGKLVVEGWSILHELYKTYEIEWAFGGCYIEQLKATKHFYSSLVRAGIEPIVIVRGGGSESSIEDSICRRSRNINKILSNLRKQHENCDTKEYSSHQMPILSWHVYISSLKQLDGVQVFVADGKEHTTVVQLANTYSCPVLTNNSICCVSGVTEGVILVDELEFGPGHHKFGSSSVFTDDLKLETCIAPIFKQSEMIRLLHLQNPDLLYVIVAIVGDYDSLPFQYYGCVKGAIESASAATRTPLRNTSSYINIADFLRAHRCLSFKDFIERIEHFRFGGQWHTLLKNCHTAFEVYNIPRRHLDTMVLKNTSTLSCLTPSNPCSKHILERYRVGNFPDQVIDAVVVGKCTMNPDVGDPDQPPVQQVGEQIRSIMYGMAMPLSLRSRRIIEEYHRSDKLNDGKWDYVPFKIQPLSKYEHLSVERIFDFDEDNRQSRERAAKAAMCEMLEMPKDALQGFSGLLEREYLLGILVTGYWAQHLFHSSQLDEPNKLIKALVLNFFFSPERRGAHQSQQYWHPKWIKVYHALLEWQSLYHDVCGLNAMLLFPFLQLPLGNIFHGSFVTELALTSRPEVIAKYRLKLIPPKQRLYDRIVEFLIR